MPFGNAALAFNVRPLIVFSRGRIRNGWSNRSRRGWMFTVLLADLA
jgi:hypothetical protein